MPKAVKDTDIQLIYYDLRERIDNTTKDLFATTEEVQAIIDNYGLVEEDDEGMVVETTWVKEDGMAPCYITDIDASAIEAAFKAGKNVVVHFPSFSSEDQNEVTPASYGIYTDGYFQLVGISDAYSDDYKTYNPGFHFNYNGFIYTGNESSAPRMVSQITVENGKLLFFIVDD